MSYAVLFVLVFVGLFVLRIILATIFFFMILPADDHCLNCDAPTLRIASKFDRLSRAHPPAHAPPECAG